MFPLSASIPVTIDPEDIVTDIETISKLFPRTEGSAGEDQLILFLTERLDKGDIDYREERFEEALGFHSFSRILEAEILGNGGELINLVVPLNGARIKDANASATGIALALGLLENLAGRNPEVGLRVLFMGGEFDSHPDAPLGTKQFLSLYSPESPAPFFYLNLSLPPENLRIRTGGQGVIAPRWLIERTAKVLEKTKISSQIGGEETQFFRLGLGGEETLIQSYLEEGYAALLLEGEGELPREDWGEWIHQLLFFFTFFMDESIEGFPEEEDIHYLFFQLGSRFLIIPEIRYVLILLVVLGGLMLYPFFARRRFWRYSHMIQRHIWVPPALVVIIFFFLLLGTLTVDAMLAVRGSQDLWRTNPIPFYLLKISGALLCYSLLFRFSKKLPFSRKGNFYSASALLLLLIDLFIISFINISFSYYILWSFLFAFLYTIFRRRSVKVICLVISMSWLFNFLIGIFTHPQEDLIRILLLSRIKGNLLQAFILLPFIFLIIRLSFLFFIPNKAVRKMIGRSTVILLSGISGALLLYLGTFDPYDHGRSQPVRVTDQVDLAEGMRTVHLESPAALPVDRLPFGGTEWRVDDSAETEISTESIPPAPEILLEERPFLRRREVLLTVLPGEMTLPPSLITLRLSSREELIILDSNFPYTLEGQAVGGGAEVHLGANPPLPLSLSFIIPDTMPLRGEITIGYDLPMERYEKDDRIYLITGGRTYKASFTLPGPAASEGGEG